MKRKISLACFKNIKKFQNFFKSLFLVYAILCSSVLIAETKIATVDVSRVLNESKEAKTKRAELDALGMEAKRKVENKKKVLKDMETKLKESKVSEDSKEFENFKNQARDLSRYVKDTEEDLKEKFLKSNKALTEKTLGIIKEYAENNKIDLVLDKSQAQRGPVLYGIQGVDITDDIVAQVNK
jgi:Skp family chaperone for outer membrane proteins